MTYLVIKYLVTSALVVLISEIARRNDRMGSLLASLPLVTILTLLWLKYENADPAKISNHTYYTFWFVLPTLPMFYFFPRLYSQFGFWLSLALSIVSTILLFFVYNLILNRFGIKLI